MAKTAKKKVSAKWKKLFKLIPGYDPIGTADPREHYFDEDDAQLKVEFIEACCKHVKGELADKPFLLEDWEKAIIGCLFGWKRTDGTRRYREMLLYVARKNGKTPLCACIILILLCCDGEPGAEIIGAASEYAQAAKVFQHAAGMVRKDDALSAKCRVYNGQAKSIVLKADPASVYAVVSSNEAARHGDNLHGGVIDELHTLKGSEFLDATRTAFGARRQPLLVMITTADFEREGSCCNKVHDHAKKVRDGVLADAEFLPAIFEADVKDDWKLESTWRKANPNLGVSISLDYLKRECQRAIEEPEYQATFQRLHCNIRTRRETVGIEMDKWDNCGGSISESDYLGRQCWGGLDLGSTSDLTALSLAFPNDNEGFDFLWWFWVPEERALRRQRQDRVPYLTWADQGLITLTDGDEVDYAHVRRDINVIGDSYGAQELAVDRLFQGAEMCQNLAADGFNVVAFGQGFMSMAGPSNEFRKLVNGGRLRHGDNPVATWMASNVQWATDPAGNIKPDKAKSGNKIDGIVASIMALGRAMERPRKTASIYETRGVLSLVDDE